MSQHCENLTEWNCSLCGAINTSHQLDCIKCSSTRSDNNNDRNYFIDLSSVRSILKELKEHRNVVSPGNQLAECFVLLCSKTKDLNTMILPLIKQVYEKEPDSKLFTHSKFCIPLLAGIKNNLTNLEDFKTVGLFFQSLLIRNYQPEIIQQIATSLTKLENKDASEIGLEVLRFASVSNFRTMQIFPADDMIKSTKHLPTPSSDWMAERLFRLLRSELISEIRKELDELLNPSSLSNESATRIFQGVQFGTPGHHPKIFSVSFDQPEQKGKMGLFNYWEKHAEVLAENSLVCFLKDGKPIRFGLVAERNEVKLSNPRASIGIAFISENMRDTILEMETRFDDLKMVQLSVNYLSYKSILRSLQKIKPTPLINSLNAQNFEARSPIANLSVIQKIDSADMAKIVKSVRKIQLSSTEQQTLKNVLTQQIAKVQLSEENISRAQFASLIAKIILDNTSSIVLCISNSQSSLDKFMEELLDYGASKEALIRFAERREVSERLRDVTLDHMQPKFAKENEKLIFADQRWKEDRNTENKIQALLVTPSSISWEDLEDFLESQGKTVELSQLRIPQSTSEAEVVVGRKGRKVYPGSLWRAWKEGHAIPEHLQDANGPLWKLSKEGRQRLIESWCSEIRELDMSQILELIKKLAKSKKEYAKQCNLIKIPFLRPKRILGCTVSDLWKYKPLLDMLSASVVIIEGAQNVKEAAILSVLSQKTNHLILLQ